MTYTSQFSLISSLNQRGNDRERTEAIPTEVLGLATIESGNNTGIRWELSVLMSGQATVERRDLHLLATTVTLD